MEKAYKVVNSFSVIIYTGKARELLTYKTTAKANGFTDLHTVPITDGIGLVIDIRNSSYYTVTHKVLCEWITSGIVEAVE